MSFGLPIITTENSGSLVENDVDGFIVPIRDIDLMAERLRRLFYNPTLCESMKLNALKKAKGVTWTKYREGLRSSLYSCM